MQEFSLSTQPTTNIPIACPNGINRHLMHTRCAVRHRLTALKSALGNEWLRETKSTDRKWQLSSHCLLITELQEMYIKKKKKKENCHNSFEYDKFLRGCSMISRSQSSQPSCLTVSSWKQSRSWTATWRYKLTTTSKPSVLQFQTTLVQLQSCWSWCDSRVILLETPHRSAQDKGSNSGNAFTYSKTDSTLH